ncbi:MAG: HTTM domain-containing protein [Balneolaceae bacterium]
MNSQKLDRWIFESFSVTPEGLGFFRITFSLFILFFLMPDTSNFGYLSSLPADFYSPPPGPMMLLNEFPPEPVFWLIYGLLFISLCFLLIGYETRKSSIAAGIFILLLKGLAFSIGKINHDLLLAVVPLVMAFSNWGAAFSVDAARGKTVTKVNSWPLTLLALLIGFMMFTAGFPKILGGWLDPATQATEGHFLNQFFTKERQALLAEYIFYIEMDYIWELMDWGTIVFETGFLFAVFNSRWFKLFICIAVLFHFSTLAILNIAFLVNYIAYAAFLDWDKIFKIFHEWSRNLTGRVQQTTIGTPAIYGILLLTGFSIIKMIANSDLFFGDSEIAFHEFYFSALAMVLILYLGIGKIKTTLEERLKLSFT